MLIEHWCGCSSEMSVQIFCSWWGGGWFLFYYRLVGIVYLLGYNSFVIYIFLIFPLSVLSFLLLTFDEQISILMMSSLSIFFFYD